MHNKNGQHKIHVNFRDQRQIYSRIVDEFIFSYKEIKKKNFAVFCNYQKKKKLGNTPTGIAIAVLLKTAMCTWRSRINRLQFKSNWTKLK